MRVLMLFVALTWSNQAPMHDRAFNMALLTCQPFDISEEFKCRHAPEWSAMVDELRKIEI